MLIEKLVYVAQLGSRAVLYILLALSVLSIGVIFERWWYFRRRKVDAVALGETLRKFLRAGDVAGARAALKACRKLIKTPSAPKSFLQRMHNLLKNNRL